MAISTMSPKNAQLRVKAKKPIKSKVSFSEVQVRMYPVTLGHNPGGVEGPPLSLSWNYTNLGKATVEDFESHRHHFQRRTMRNLHISASRRVTLLRSAGFSDQQIYKAAQDAAFERKSRQDSVQDTIRRVRALKARKQAAMALAQLQQQPAQAELTTLP